MAEYQKETGSGKHVPGPWTEPRVYRNPRDEIYKVAVYGAGGRTTVHRVTGSDSTDWDEVLATARLISTTLKMLASLQNIAARPDVQDENDLQDLRDELQTVIDKARATVAEVRGEG